MDRHAYWRRELNYPGSESRDTMEPIDGFWRFHNARTKIDWPVAIWEDQNGVMHLKFGGNPDTVKSESEWHDFMVWKFPKCSAITEDEYHTARKTGSWPDGKQSISTKASEERGSEDYDWGTNSPEPIDLVDEEITLWVEKLEQLGDLETQDKANKGTEILALLRGLLKSGEAMKMTERQPYDAQAAEVETKWGRVLKPATVAVDDLKLKIRAFLKAEEERRNQQTVGVEPEPFTKAQVRTPFGRATGLVTRSKGVIVDEAKFIRAIKGDQDFKDFLQKKADALARSKSVRPGMQIEKVRT